MKYNYAGKIAIIMAILSLSHGISAQLSPDTLQQFLLSDKKLKTFNIKSISQVKEFYEKYNHKIAWIQAQNITSLHVLLDQLKSSSTKGLEMKDYQYSFVNSFMNGSFTLLTKEDSLEAEIRLTDAALHFYNDLAYGNTKPSFGYYGIKYTPDCKNVPAHLAEYLSKNLLQLLPSQLSPALPEVVVIEKKLRWINEVISENSFREIIITSTKVNIENKALVEKLYQLGIINSLQDTITDSILKQKVKEAQRMFNVLADTTLRSNSLREFNTPVLVRQKQLNLSINYYKWMYCLNQSQSIINVNIPAAYLKVYRNNNVILEMRVIVGKKSTSTPTLASTVDQVILYPYWHVPFSIATKELLPAIKKNPGYINAGNYQVLNGAGKIMDPYSINWHAYSTSYFPYVIRQSTGCDNALGLLKLNFYSPFGVYLHDTPKKGLFNTSKRFYSHGCMRMEKPMELGHLILKNNALAIDSLEQKSCLRNQSPTYVHADEHMPVIVWYNPVGIDITGRLIFYEDVYGKWNWNN